ncbi:MAG: CHAD domain-containing protein [Minicystis sp.]
MTVAPPAAEAAPSREGAASSSKVQAARDSPRDGATAEADRREARHAHDFLAPALFAMIAEVRRSEARVAATTGGSDDPEAIHDFRVALRRLRTVLRPARRVFGKRRLREIAAELRRFAQATGTLRDEEVLRETLGALALPPRARAELDRWLVQRARQERVRRRAVAALLITKDGPRGPSLGTALAHLERRIGRRRREELPVTALAGAATAAAFADVRALAAADPRDGAAMHELRVRFKRLRYTADLFGPAMDERGAAVAKLAARMQKRLGELHDLDEALIRIGRARGLSKAAALAVRRALLRARREAAGRAHGDLGDHLDRIAAALNAG